MKNWNNFFLHYNFYINFSKFLKIIYMIPWFIFSISKNIATENLKSYRESLINEIKANFNFLDDDGNEIDEDDEEYFKLEDILKNNIIKIKVNNSNAPNNLTEKKELNPITEETNNMKERQVLDYQNMKK